MTSLVLLMKTTSFWILNSIAFDLTSNIHLENVTLQGKFTEYSGVWMLAVTVWELATGARERPFHTMNDTQVILNADHFYYSDGREVISLYKCQLNSSSKTFYCYIFGR